MKHYAKPIKVRTRVICHGKPAHVLGYSTDDALIEYEDGSFATVSWYEIQYAESEAIGRGSVETR